MNFNFMDVISGTEDHWTNIITKAAPIVLPAQEMPMILEAVCYSRDRDQIDISNYKSESHTVRYCRRYSIHCERGPRPCGHCTTAV